MLILRRATPDDTIEVAGVHVRSWQAGYRGLLPQEYLDSLNPRDRAARYTFGATGPGQPVTAVAIEQSTICGFATTAACRDDDAAEAGELCALYVDPGHWGRGVGRTLLADARDRLAQEGFLEAVLWVLVGNERAERLYRADGWALDGSRRQEQLWGVTADEVRYRRMLGSSAGAS